MHGHRVAVRACVWGKSVDIEPASELSREDALRLLGYYLPLAPPRWQTQQAFISVFVTVDIAILAASIGVLDKFLDWPRNLILLMGPIAAFGVALLAKRALRSQERRIRELIVVIARLEELVGLDRPMYAEKPESAIWPDDNAVLPDRWMMLRRAHSHSKEFIENSELGGTGKAALQMFTLLQVIAVLLAALLFVIPAF